MKVNTNTHVNVTLTMTGAATYNDHMGQFPRKHRIRVEPGQVLRLPLWEAMEIFGSTSGAGGPETPFVANEVDLEVQQELRDRIEHLMLSFAAQSIEHEKAHRELRYGNETAQHEVDFRARLAEKAMKLVQDLLGANAPAASSGNPA